MKDLNKMRLSAGLPIDPSIEITEKVEEKRITEARETPKRRTELAATDKRTLGAKVRGVKRAMDHIKQAIAALEKIPATDFAGEIPHFIRELEDLVDGDEMGGMAGFLEKAEDEQANFGKEDVEPEPEMDMDEPDMDAEMSDDPEMDAMAPEDEMGDDEEMAYESDADDFLKNLSAEEKEQLKTAITTLRMISGGPMIRETMEKIADITGKTLEEAMHYYNVNYDSFEETGDKERPVNVSDGTSNDEQVMDTLDPVKKEGPEQLKTMDQQDNSPQDKSGDDLSTKVKVPNGIKQALRTEIEDAKREAEKLDVRDKDAANFYKDLARAFEDLLGHLEKGTRYDMKQAQVFAQSLMGPMLHKIPNEVWKFISNGGEARSLKSYMTPVDKKFPITGPRNTLK